MEYEKSASGSVYLIKSDKGYWLPGGFGYTSNKAEALPELVALGWTVTEFAAGKYDITRPKAAGCPPPLYCKQDIFIFYIQWLIFLLIGNTMKNTMLRKGLTIF